jgi:signal peptidase I
MPGLGHVYNGEPGRGLLAYLLQPVVFALGNVIFLSTFPGLVAVLLLVLVLYLGVTVSAALRAQHLGEIQLRWYNRAAVYLILFFGVTTLTGSILRRIVMPALPYRAYAIPAGSMEPTLQIGDHVIVDTWTYRKQPPQRGDVTVFRFPPDPARDFVKRCMAVPGDVVAIHDKQLSINGKPVAEAYARHDDPKVLGRDSGPMGARDQFGPETVPPQSYFCLGDNRDNSNDSRFWGYVRDDLLKAKALYVYWAKDRSRIGQRIH